MAKKAGTVDPYPASPDGLMAMMQDPEYVNAKYTALQDRSFEVLQLDKTAGGHVLKVDRIVDANLPDFAKKVLGDTNRLVQTEVWTKSGAGYKAEVDVQSPGKPITIKGTMNIQPHGENTSKWTVDFEIKGTLPLMGKIEQIVANETQDNLGKEYTFNKGWLASH